MKNIQELTPQQMFDEIINMIDEKPELFHTLSDLCDKALDIINNQ